MGVLPASLPSPAATSAPRRVPLGAAPAVRRPVAVGPSSRTGVLWAEAKHLGHSAWSGLHLPRPRPQANPGDKPTFGQDWRLLWNDADYRSQAKARWLTHLGQGLGSGVQTSMLSMTTSLTAAQGLLVNSCINAAELLVHQLAGVWRGLFSDDARNGVHRAGNKAGSPRLGRHQLVSRLLLAGIYEVGIAACLLGVLACRGARFLHGKRILLALAAIRVARIFCQTTQWASFDGLKGQLGDARAAEVVKRRWDSTKAVETGVGLGLNQGAAIACQLLPYAIPFGSLAGAMGCLMGAGLLISLTGKLRLRHYLDEGKRA